MKPRFMLEALDHIADIRSYTDAKSPPVAPTDRFLACLLALSVPRTVEQRP